MDRTVNVLSMSTVFIASNLIQAIMKQRLFHLILFCLILPSFAIAQQRVSLITGTVTDVQTKEPLGGIEMRLESSFGLSQTVMTDASGQYSFKVDAQRFQQFEYRVTADGIPQKAVNGHLYLATQSLGTPHHAMLTSRWIADFQLQCADYGEIELPHVIYYLAKWELRVDGNVNSLDSLRYLYDVMVENPSIIIELQAHTDTRGTERANSILSQKRAEACANHLIEWGIAPQRVVPFGYGESRPRITDEQIGKLPTKEECEAAHARNRRTSFQVLSTDYKPAKVQPPLIYKLEGTVTDVETKEPLGNMLVTLEGTDGSVQYRITDAEGYYAFETDFNDQRCVLPNTSYTVTVENGGAKSSNGFWYFSARGQETTVGVNESTRFIKDYQLQCNACRCGEVMLPKVIFPGETTALQNEQGDMRDSLDYLVQVLEENPTIVIEVAAHAHLKRASDRKEMKLSQQRAEVCVDYLASKGIDPQRLVPVGYGDTRLIISEEQMRQLEPNDVDRAYVINNRAVFMVLSFDYVPEETKVVDNAPKAKSADKTEDSKTALEQESVSNTWQVYPNPTKDAVLLRSENVISEWQLLDMEGRLLDRKRSGTQQQLIDLADYPTGTYFIRWNEGPVVNTAKVVKQ